MTFRRDRKTMLLAPAILAANLGGCMVGPTYHRPALNVPPAYKEAAGWSPAAPSDAADRTDWWTVFGDPILNDLEAKVIVSNLTLAADEAAYRQAHALVAQDRAALFPTITLNGSDTATKPVSGVTVNGISGGGSNAVRTTYQPSIGGTWAPDLWGAVRRTLGAAKANAQASAATLANARLSMQTELAADYIQLRQYDEQRRLLAATADGYERTLAIVRNRYTVGVAAQSDLLSAQSQFDTSQANLIDVERSRAKTEHAIAILIGQAPAAVTIAPSPWTLKLPLLPATVPATITQRRPDIAAAERSAAAASEQIGVQTAAYFPNITLTGQGGYSSSALGQLFSSSTSFWSVGAAAAETLVDFGSRHAKVAQARAAYAQAVANYRLTVLNALGQVEDNLAAQRVLVAEQAHTRSAADAASRSETIVRNQYAAGTVDFTTVVTAEATANNARNTELNIEAAQLTTAADLIEALGGGWTTNALPRD